MKPVKAIHDSFWNKDDSEQVSILLTRCHLTFEVGLLEIPAQADENLQNIYLIYLSCMQRHKMTPDNGKVMRGLNKRPANTR